jgi:hypothetical protein
MREYETALRRLLEQVNGTAVIVSSLKLARQVCGIEGRGRPEGVEVRRAGIAMFRQYHNLPPGFLAEELEGGTFTAKFWREHHESDN